MALAPQLEAKLKAIVADERDAVVRQITIGSPASFAEYREQVGFLRALTQVDGWIAEAYADIEKDER